MLSRIRQYSKHDLPALMSSWENASAIAHPFLTSEFQDKVRQDIPSLYLPNADTCWVTKLEHSSSSPSFRARGSAEP